MKSRSVLFIILLLILAMVIFGLDYAFMPALSPYSRVFWNILAVASASLIMAIALAARKKGLMVGALIVGGLVFLASLVLSMGSCQGFPGNDRRLYSQLECQEYPADQFTKDFPATMVGAMRSEPGQGDGAAGQGGASGDQAGSGGQPGFVLPMIDKDLSVKIAQGKMGGYGAQYQIDPNYFTLIHAKRDGRERILRVVPLDYSGPMVALSSGGAGSPGYIEVDLESCEARLVEVEGGLKYTPRAAVFKNLARHLRYRYRGSLFGPYSFEIDDQGKPFWIVPVLKNRVGLFGGSDIVATIVVDPRSGQSQRYAKGKEPAWVDRVVPANIAMRQANDHLGLKNGWVNRDLGQKREVYQLSDGYNYVVGSDGAGQAVTWLVAGVTSPNEADQTLVGLMAINLRTKEARRYAIGGITEMRAMEIAVNDEKVKAQGLSSTWPIMVNVDTTPAYFLLLKNQVQRQRFAFIDVASGQRLSMAEDFETARRQFALQAGRLQTGSAEDRSIELGIFRLRFDEIAGTAEFIARDNPKIMYIAPLSLGNGARFLQVGDQASVSYRESPSNPGLRYVTGLRNLSVGE